MADEKAVQPGAFPFSSRPSTKRLSIFRTASILCGAKTIAVVGLIMTSMIANCGTTPAPEPLPFDVSNPNHKKWSPEEAKKIYDSACALVARSIRPENPPKLHPKFLLVLGSSADEIVRNDTQSEVHLKSWDANKFAEAAVIMVAREVVKGDELRSIAHMSVLSAQATASVEQLRRR